MRTKTLALFVLTVAALIAIAVGVGVGVPSRNTRHARNLGIAAPDPSFNRTAQQACTINISETDGYDPALLSNASTRFAASNLTFNGTEFTIFAPENTAFLPAALAARLGRNVTNDTEFTGLLAYHIVPGLYDPNTNQLAPSPPANNTVGTELGAILSMPQNVNFTAINSTTTRVTDDSGASANATYVGNSLAGEDRPSCQWALYRTSSFLVPTVIRNDRNGSIARQVAGVVQQGPVISIPVPAQTPSQNQSSGSILF